LFCATQVCPFTIKSISNIHGQSCCTTRNVAQHDWSCMGPSNGQRISMACICVCVCVWVREKEGARERERVWNFFRLIESEWFPLRFTLIRAIYFYSYSLFFENSLAREDISGLGTYVLSKGGSSGCSRSLPIFLLYFMYSYEYNQRYKFTYYTFI
jgi:hypothetical protein